MNGDLVVMIISITACLFLATRALRWRRLGFNKLALMAGVWVIIIAVLAFVIQRFAA